MQNLRGPKRRGFDVVHPAGNRHKLGIVGHDKRCFHHGFVANTRTMYIGFVGQIHQVVYDQAVIALHGDQLAVARPSRVVVPMHVWHQCRIGQRRVTHPQPNKAVFLHQRKTAHTGRGVDFLQTGHANALPFGVVNQSVVTTDHIVAL